MKMADILRKVADLIDQTQDASDSDDLSSNRTQQRMTTVTVNEPDADNSPVMVPPLQTKLEILKKSEGIPNVYDNNEPGNDIILMKKLAGISTAQKEASEDNDITG